MQDICEPVGIRQRPPEIDVQSFSVVERLAEGDTIDQFKAIYYAASGLPNYLVSVKILHSSSDSVQRQGLLQEAALLVGLDHPHVIKLIGVVTLSDPTQLVLEYCEFGHLEYYVTCQELSVSTECRLAGDVADGMAYLHTRHIVHRDLAACNVMVDSTHRCKVMLTGLSRDMFGAQAVVYQGDSVAVRWCAPECLTEQLFGEQSDVWAYGVVLYEIWTRGDVPFADMMASQVRELLLTNQKTPPLPQRCPVELERILKACWSIHGSRPAFLSIVKDFRGLEINILRDDDLISIKQPRVDEV